MAATFGRKGLTPGEPAAPVSGSGGGSAPAFGLAHEKLADPSDEEMARRRKAFLIEEGLRRIEKESAEAVDAALERSRAFNRSRPSLRTAYLLWLLAGQVSAHRFYLRAGRSALDQLAVWLVSVLLLSFGDGDILAVGLGTVLGIVWVVWWILDFFRIPAIRRRFWGW